MAIPINVLEKLMQKKKKSVLFSAIDDIRELRENDVSLVNIQIWLEKEGIETSVENIRLFCIRNKIFTASKAKKKVVKRTHDTHINEETKGSKISFLDKE